MKDICGCCEGLEKAVPLSTANRPYLDALSYRVGTHATFLETMVANLTDHSLDILSNTGERIRPLQELTVRGSDDPSIAILDAWAVVADVLTFYQERIANEGYLRTATERRSILELAKLVGYSLRPGVSASVFLAFNLEKGYNLTIDPGMRVQTLPGPGELPQSFETSEPLEAREVWNSLGVRTTKPQYINRINADPEEAGMEAINKVFLSGISASLNPNDPLLMVFDPIIPIAVFRQVESAELQPAKNRTMVKLQTPAGEGEQKISSVSPDDLSVPLSKPVSRLQTPAGEGEQGISIVSLDDLDLLASLSKPASRPPATPRRLARSIEQSFGSASDIGPQLLTALNLPLKHNLYAAWVGAKVVEDSDMKSLDALRVKARPFGHNAPLKPIYDDGCVPIGHEEWPLTETVTASVSITASQIVVASSGLAARAVASTVNIVPVPVLFSVKRGAKIQSRLVWMSPGMLLTNPTINLGDEVVRITLTPGIRFINLLEGTSNVDVYANGIKVLENVPFASEKIVLQFVLMPPIDGTELKLQVTEAGESIKNSLITRDIAIDEGKAYTIVALGKDKKRRLTVLADELPASADEATVHFVHASIGTPQVNFSIDREGNVLASEKGISFAGSISIITSPGKADWTIEETKTKENIHNGSLVLGAGGIYIVLLAPTSENDHTSVAINADISLSDKTPLLLKSILSIDFTALERKFKLSLEKGTNDYPLVNVRVLSGGATILRDSLSVQDILERSIGGHRIRVEYYSPNCLISDESPIPLSQDQKYIVALESKFDEILPGSLAVIEKATIRPPEVERTIARVLEVQTVSKADFGITGDVTQLILDRPWLTDSDTTLASLRNTVVYAQNEPLDISDEEIDPVEGAVCGDAIELDGLYDGLKSGRWLIVSGERTDVPATSGVMASELAMLASVTQGVQNLPEDEDDGEDQRYLPGDKTHTFIKLAEKLAYCYKLDTVKIYANVAKATHGETRNEVLGSGDASRDFQKFQLRQSPLTYLAAATPAGAESTLQVRVDDLLWHEIDSLAESEPTDRSYITASDDESKTKVIFGNGERGSRLPTRAENVRAVYRSGIGKPGNARAGQISLLATRPLGVKSVINPLPATGGADREDRDQARRNVPLAVLALDRLVSVQDYADFSRTFAGIGKAMAAELSDERRRVVFITIAGTEDIPIDYHSDLYVNLLSALHKLGDPHLQIRVETRELLLLVISAKVRVKSDYLWDKVEPLIKAELLDTFSFERRDLGQDVLPSEVIGAIQGVKGVDYVDVDVIAGIPEKKLDDGVRRILTPEEMLSEVKKALEEGTGPLHRVSVNLAGKEEDGLFRPDQIAYLTPDVPDTLILTELKE